jgi:hypothetical protein
MHYATQAAQRGPGDGLTFDARYRCAQLPLFAPEHPLALNQDPDGRYRDGRRSVSHSLVIRVDGHALAESASLQELLREMQSSPLGDKIAWDMEARRRDVLHATICGVIPHTPPEPIPEKERGDLSRIRSFRFRVQGLFTGSFNTGRIYLCLYPELRGGEPATDAVGKAMGAGANRLLVCGYLNLLEELDAAEASLLDEYCRKSAAVIFDTQDCVALSVFESFDDLVLDSREVDRVELSEAEPPCEATESDRRSRSLIALDHIRK